MGIEAQSKMVEQVDLDDWRIFSVKGGGVTPEFRSGKKTNKKELLLAKITLILTLFDPVLLGKFSTIFCYGPIAK